MTKIETQVFTASSSALHHWAISLILLRQADQTNGRAYLPGESQTLTESSTWAVFELVFLVCMYLQKPAVFNNLVFQVTLTSDSWKTMDG